MTSPVTSPTTGGSRTDYFPPIDQYFGSPSDQWTSEFGDHLFHESTYQDHGTPTVGIYAQDGIWDDDESNTSYTCASTASPSIAASSDKHNVNPVTHNRWSIRPSGNTSSGIPSGSASSRVSFNKARSRSGTVSNGVSTEEKMSGWGSWRRHAGTSSIDHQAEAKPVLKEKKSSRLLKGRGRKGELSVVLADTPASPALSTPPLISGTGSQYTDSPAMSTASCLSPKAQFRYPGDSPIDSTAKSRSSWRKGVKSIFRSKSSLALREVTGTINNAPPVPEMPSHLSNLPKQSKHPLGNAFSASTPPMSSTPLDRRTTERQRGKMSAPPTTIPIHDPFASSLDMADAVSPKPYKTEAVPFPTRPKLPKHSPSFKDLKSMLSGKPRLGKAKSMANLKEESASKPPMPSEPDFIPYKPIRSPSGALVGLGISNHTWPAPSVFPSVIQQASTPVESPPLLPPQPPYFPVSASIRPRNSSSISSLSGLGGLRIDTSVATDPTALSPISSPPKVPLPPLPAPSSSTLAPASGSPRPSPIITRRGSSAVLLPRSRSTSVSLRSPPTSSSFFDLYEQLGIWPTPENTQSEISAPSMSEGPSSTGTDRESSSLATNTPPISAPMTTETSRTEESNISAESWDAAVNSFPMIEGLSERTHGQQGMDFGGPNFEDPEIAIETIGDETFASNMATVSLSPTPSASTHTLTISAAASGTGSSSNHGHSGRSRETSTQHGGGRSNHATGNNDQNQSWRMSRKGSGNGSRSNDSSRSPSRNRKNQNKDWSVDQWESSSDEKDEEEDDVPLSKLHPGAADLQRAKSQKAVVGAVQVKLRGRNPGGGTGWNGEGGVPPEILWNKLQDVLRLSSAQFAQAASGPSTLHPVRGDSLSVRQRERSEPVPSRSRSDASSYNHHQRATTDVPPPQQAAAVSRTTTLRRPSSSRSRESPRLPPMISVPPPNFPGIASGLESQRSASPRSPMMTQSPNSLTRNNTAVTTRSTRPTTTTTTTRNRSYSNASSVKHGMASDENMIRTQALLEPMPQLPKPHATHVKAFVGNLEGRKVTIEILPSTTPGEVIHSAMKNGDLPSPEHGCMWVIVELFAEVGCERQLREYEPLLSVVKGWDAGAKYDCLIFKSSNRALPTLQRAIPQTPPFLGSWIQYESKKGKWSKRWLETRGGQIFLAKNEKNKDEVHINTAFFDIYEMTRAYSAPKPCVFVVKRMEPESTFENPEDYMHVFSAEQGIAWKLMAAIYDAKSYALLPQLRERQQLQSSQLNQQQQQYQPIARRPTLPAGGPATKEPLVSLQKDSTGGGAFTGKGLLK